MQVDQDAHQLDHRDGRVRIVQLDRGTLVQRAQVGVFLQMPPDQILQRCGDEEELLAQAEFLAGRRGIARVENLGDRFGPHSRRQGADVVALVERVEPQRVGRTGRPQAQGVDVLAAPAHHGNVIGHGFDGFGRMPCVARDTIGRFDDLHGSAKADVVGDLGARELPGIAEGEPVLRIFVLPAVLDDLPEQAVIVADAVAVGRNRQGRHAFHEAGSKPAEAAVAEGGIGLDLAQAVEVDAKPGQGLAHRLGQAEIHQGIEQQPAHQELERHVVHALGLPGIGGPVGLLPAADDVVADRVGSGQEPVALTCVGNGLADRINQFGQDSLAQGFGAPPGAELGIKRDSAARGHSGVLFNSHRRPQRPIGTCL